MSDPNARFQTVNVEQIMAQIRARIRERRGADHADAQIRELAAARLAGLVGSHGAREALVENLRRAAKAAPGGESVADSPLYGRPGPLRWIRRLLSPVLALFLSPTGVVHALGRQDEGRARQEQLSAMIFELVEDLVIETTRLEVEVKKLEMRVESQSARLEFAERRARFLEGSFRPRAEQEPDPEFAPRRATREPGVPAQGRPPRDFQRSAQGGAGRQPQRGRDAQPPAGRDAQPPAGRDAQPPASRDAQPPASRDAQPPASRDAQPPASRDIESAAGRDAEAQVGRDAQPQVNRDAESQVGRDAEQPGAGGEAKRRRRRRRGRRGGANRAPGEPVVAGGAGPAPQADGDAEPAEAAATASADAPAPEPRHGEPPPEHDD